MVHATHIPTVVVTPVESTFNITREYSCVNTIQQNTVLTTHPCFNVWADGFMFLHCSFHLGSIVSKTLVWQHFGHIIQPWVSQCGLKINVEFCRYFTPSRTLLPTFTTNNIMKLGNKHPLPFSQTFLQAALIFLAYKDIFST